MSEEKKKTNTFGGRPRNGEWISITQVELVQEISALTKIRDVDVKRIMDGLEVCVTKHLLNAPLDGGAVIELWRGVRLRSKLRKPRAITSPMRGKLKGGIPVSQENVNIIQKPALQFKAEFTAAWKRNRNAEFRKLLELLDSWEIKQEEMEVDED